VNDKIHFDRSRGIVRRDEKQPGQEAGQSARYMSVRGQSETQYAQIHTDQIDTAQLATKKPIFIAIPTSDLQPACRMHVSISSTLKNPPWRPQ
jgi:hypothetical protein